jgi:hypothetical protein
MAALREEGLSSSDCCRAGRVMMGGSRAVPADVRLWVRLGPTCRGEFSTEDGVLCEILGGDCGDAELPKVNAPETPRLMRRVKLLDLLCGEEVLLEVVDCDHRLRFPTPSFMS